MSRTDPRTAILARVRAAQRTAVLPHEHPDDEHVARVPPPPSVEDTLARFELELTVLGVEVHHAPSDEAVRATVSAIVEGRRVLTWDAAALPYDVFAVLSSPVTASSTREEQACAEIGLTACDAAVADTGSLVLLSGAGRSRAVSLLPLTHLAVVRPADIVATLSDAFRRLHDRMMTAAACTVITGPSRTADIELTLTLGIHGPGRVIVVIGP